jgi:hypothetical protein
LREGRQIALLFTVTMAIGLVGVALASPLRLFPSLDHAAALFVLGTPFLFLLLYIVHGREPDETVPQYLSDVPNPARKPWEVNLVFRSDTFEATDDAFYATVLDLQRRGYVALGQAEADGRVRMRILKPTSGDPYEQNVLTFLGFIGEGRIPGPEEVGRLFLSTLQSDSALFQVVTTPVLQLFRGGFGPRLFSLGGLIRPPKDAVSTFFEDGRRRVIPVFLAAAAFYLLATFLPVVSWGPGILFGPLFSPAVIFTAIFCFIIFLALLRDQGTKGGMGRARHLVLYLFLAFLFLVIVLPATVFAEISPAQMLMYVVGFQCLATTFFPPTLLGKWKGNSYREKLQWDAFRAFLSDLVKIREYSHADRTMWGDWLISGTALGVGDGVVAAMEDLHIQIPAAEMSRAIQAVVMEYAQAAAKEAQLKETGRR